MTDIVSMSTALIMFGSGKFRTDNRYLRVGSGGSPFPIVQGKSLSMLYYSGTIYPACQIRYAVNGYAKQMSSTHAGNGAVLSNSFAATFQAVRTE